MARFNVRKTELEIICRMALRQVIGNVRYVQLTLRRSELDECNWEIANIDPMPSAGLLEKAVAHIHQIQMAFNIRQDAIASGDNPIPEVNTHELH